MSADLEIVYQDGTFRRVYGDSPTVQVGSGDSLFACFERYAKVRLVLVTCDDTLSWSALGWVVVGTPYQG
jgi:hypothetical protein